MRIPDSLSDPAQHAFVVTPADADFATNLQARALYVGVTGDVRVTTVGGDDVTFANVPVGFFAVSVKRVWSTGTTASGIRGVW